MSIKAMLAVWDHSATKGNTRLVLLALADQADDDGMVVAFKRSQTYLAGRANCSVESVRQAINQAQEMGELEVLARGSGRERSDYRITVMDGPPKNLGDSRPPKNLGGTPQESGGQTPENLGAAPKDSPPPSPPSFPVSPVPARSSCAPSGARTGQSSFNMDDIPPPSAPSVKDAEPAGFAEFYAAYPRKKSRRSAAVAYGKALKRASAAQIAEGLAAVVQGWKTSGRTAEHTPYPATWLNADGWLDEPDTAPAPPAARTPASGRVQGAAYDAQFAQVFGRFMDPDETPAPALSSGPAINGKEIHA